jgi:hypothetical protein
MHNKKKRGQNKSIKFSGLIEYGPVPIEIHAEARGPVGNNASQFSRRATIVVHQHADLWHGSWTRVPPKERQLLRNRVLVSFIILCYVIYYI